MESEQISEETKEKLKKLYQSLNPRELKRKIDEKVHKLFKAYERKRQTPSMMQNHRTQQSVAQLIS